MALPILAVAFAIYIFGIATVLFLRPSMMFKPGGNWKEFGIGRGETHTILPFWLFAIFWAFISYGVALVVLSQFANVANSSSPGQQHPTSQYPQPQISYSQGNQGMFAQMTHPQAPMQAPAPQAPAPQAPAPQAPAPQAPVPQAPVPQAHAPQAPAHQAPVNMSGAIKPVSSMIGLNQNLPGYYVLAKHTQTGQPQYVYYGHTPPSVENY